MSGLIRVNIWVFFGKNRGEFVEEQSRAAKNSRFQKLIESNFLLKSLGRQNSAPLSAPEFPTKNLPHSLLNSSQFSHFNSMLIPRWVKEGRRAFSNLHVPFLPILLFYCSTSVNNKRERKTKIEIRLIKCRTGGSGLGFLWRKELGEWRK